MAGKIPQSFIDDLLNRVDVVDVVDSRVPLKKAGSLYKACCPFHNEKTPSFTVSPSRQTYHCFGCGVHGTAIGFLMEYEQLSFPEAVEELAAGLHLEVPREGGGQYDASRDQRKQDHYEVLNSASQYYQRQLREHSDAPRAVDYLKSRGLSGEIVQEFGIGFAPDGWQNLLDAMKTISPQQLEQTGMVIRKDNGRHYDRFRDRIMFPIRDRRGRVIAFGGRTLGNDDAKYLNSPETDVFHKGRELYGLYELRRSTRNPHRIVVVEGYMDVVSLSQFDVRNCVATLGTATTSDHLEALYRVVDEVVFCFDGDRAGRQAAWRALENALPVLTDGRTARFLFLPDGEDPDTLVRSHGKADFDQRVATAQPLSDYFFTELASQVDMRSLDGKTRLRELATPLIETLPGGRFRDGLAFELEDRFAAGTLHGHRAFTAPKHSAPSHPYGQAGPGQRNNALQAALIQTPVRKALAILLRDPGLLSRVRIPKDIEMLEMPGVGLLMDVIDTINGQADVRGAALLERMRDHDGFEHLKKLSAWEPDERMQSKLADELQDSLQRLRQRRIKQRLAQLEAQNRMNDEEKQEHRELTRALLDS